MKEYTLSLFGLVHATTSVVIEAESSEDAYEKALVMYDEGELDWNIGNVVHDVEIDLVDPEDED
jgi:hypothetical protein